MQQTIWLCFICLMLFTGCTSPDTKKDTKEESNLTQLSTEQDTNRTKAKHISDKISAYDAVTSVSVVTDEKKAVVAIGVKQMNRFQLKPLRDKVKKAIEQMYPDLDVTVSTDKKIMLELEKLEKNMQNLSKKELKKQIEHIIKMDADET